MTMQTAIDLGSLQQDLDALRARTAREVGEVDAKHIRKVRRIATALEVSGRTLIHVSLDPVSFGLGVVSLGLYKIIENTELGHNVMHGQYDFMKDPDFDSKTYEWDMVSTAKTWKHAHNVTHHSFTNVIGKDDDFGYAYFRPSSNAAWKPLYLIQPLVGVGAALFFDHAVAFFHARAAEYLTAPEGSAERAEQARAMRKDWLGLVQKLLRQHAKDYAFYPVLAGPMAPKVALGNLLANLMRNVWTFTVIHCGHLTEATSTYTVEDIAGESRGGYYLRQILGSSNFEAGPVLGVLTGHLSHQIEHHLFPELPSHRYRALSGEVQRICAKHGIPYHNASLLQQVKSVARAMFKYALPNAASDEHRRAANIPKREPLRAPPLGALEGRRELAATPVLQSLAS
jgi:linoleoyl-CoA desaturase